MLCCVLSNLDLNLPKISEVDLAITLPCVLFFVNVNVFFLWTFEIFEYLEETTCQVHLTIAIISLRTGTHRGESAYRWLSFRDSGFRCSGAKSPSWRPPGISSRNLLHSIGLTWSRGSTRRLHF